MLTRREFLGRSAAIGAAALAAGPLARAAEETAKSEWRVGIYTRPWAAYDYRVAFDAMAEAGFKYAGLMTAKAPAGLIISPNTTHGQAHEVATEARKARAQDPLGLGWRHPGRPVGRSRHFCPQASHRQLLRRRRRIAPLGRHEREALRRLLQGDRRVLRLRRREEDRARAQAARRHERDRPPVPQGRRDRRPQELPPLVRSGQHLLLLRGASSTRSTTRPPSTAW